ncbi:carboxyl transferase domain-containing protein [Paraburkholderia sp. BL10I2N1]|uniref:acyl-CoA carboxylase subunit beta n=1 Tax=Paraburkholderia sp. BL10I2N1 TaxID=1938796 RepID=UPI00105DD8B1|nr:carboxyl transferase domain-containing protein [Paraburkholderia sp. BL10I2N1]TDN59138.1 propionyl-CoA carboxylase carboxyltransferase subunit [Paraburkholderia sp. BL10I2N1]
MDEATTTASTEWAPEIEEISARRTVALQLGGDEAIAKQHAKGKLTARERIEKLLDAGSFSEFGILAGTVKYGPDGVRQSMTPSTAISGVGRINGRKTVVAADDFTIRGGSSEGAVAEKWIYTDRYAWEYKLPIVRMIDSAGGSVKLLDKLGHTKIPGYPLLPMTQLLGAVPVVGIALGACAGLGAVRVASSHLSIMVRGQSQVFAGGPPVVKQAFGIDIDKDELGGYDAVHRHSGAVNLAVDSEEEALAAAQRFLSYLPVNVWEQPQVAACADDPQRCDPWLNDAIPRNSRKIFNPRKILKSIFDHGSLFEISPDFGGSTITCFARLNGYAVGVITNNPSVAGGALTRSAALKLARFVDLCDTFHLPIVNLVDQPGLMTGPDAERMGTITAGMQAVNAIEQSSVPWLAIVLRRCVGLAGAMISPWHGPSGTALPHRYAWPSARWGSIPIEGGVAAAYKTEIEQAPDPLARRQEIEAHYHAIASPFRTAERFGVIDIIEPATTRPLLCNWVEDAYHVARQRLGPKARTMR